MLVLSRKSGEAIRIGNSSLGGKVAGDENDIVVVVYHSRAGEVRVAIEAPKDIEILREEVWERSKC